MWEGHGEGEDTGGPILVENGSVKAKAEKIEMRAEG